MGNRARFGMVCGILVLATFAPPSRAQKAGAAVAGLVLTPSALPANPAELADPAAAGWQAIQPRRVALNRTPRLFETEPPSELEIPELDVRTARAGGRLLVRLSWHDLTEDAANIASVPGTPAEERFLKESTESTHRFFDAAAIMVPAEGRPRAAAPSLQMGDANDPVTIYYWNAGRGPMLMEARGRETTRRTGQGLPAKAIYRAGSWSVSFELPDLPKGSPLAFAVWNGSQQDRDGRKYFSVWHVLE